MTVLGIGIDLAERSRIRSAHRRHGERFAARVLHPAEATRPDARAVDALAVRFAAKEACMKALGTGWARSVSFRDIEIAEPLGHEPGLRLHGVAALRGERLGVRSIRLSVSWAGDLVAALVVMSGED